MLNHPAQWFCGLIRHEVAYNGSIVMATQEPGSLGIGSQGNANTITAIKTLGFIALAMQSTDFAILKSL